MADTNMPMMHHQMVVANMATQRPSAMALPITPRSYTRPPSRQTVAPIPIPLLLLLAATASPLVAWGTDRTGDSYYTYSGTQTPLSYTYPNGVSVDTTTTFYQECHSTVGAAPGSTKFTQVTVTALLARALST